MIALHQQKLVEHVLEKMKTRITFSLLRFALEAAAASNNVDVFEKLYQILRTRLRTGQITVEEYIRLLEKVLYWAAIRGSERIVDYILERAIAYEEAQQLNIIRVSDRVGELLERYNSLPEDERLVFLSLDQVSALLRIREGLTNAVRISDREEILREQTWLQDLPLEILSLMLTFGLRSRKP